MCHDRWPNLAKFLLKSSKLILNEPSELKNTFLSSNVDVATQSHRTIFFCVMRLRTKSKQRLVEGDTNFASPSPSDAEFKSFVSFASQHVTRIFCNINVTCSRESQRALRSLFTEKYYELETIMVKVRAGISSFRVISLFITSFAGHDNLLNTFIILYFSFFFCLCDNLFHILINACDFIIFGF